MKIPIDDKTKRFEGYKEGSILTEKVPQLKAHSNPDFRPPKLKDPLIKSSPFNIKGGNR